MPDQPQGKSAGSRLYLHASGSIGGKITATSWRGCHYWRLYKFPSKGKTVAQEKIRQQFSIGIKAWKQNFNTTNIRTDWDRAASQSATAMSGYNRFISAVFDSVDKDPGVLFVKSYIKEGDRIKLNFTQANPDAPRTDHQTVVIWIGPDERHMRLWATGELYYDYIYTPNLPPQKLGFIRVEYNGIPVSGMISGQHILNP